MPLEDRDTKHLLKDLLTYRDERKWADKNLDAIKGRASAEEIASFEARQAEAKRRIAKIEDRVTKIVVRGFPEKVVVTKAAPPKKKVVTKAVPIPEEPEIIEVPKPVLERINESMNIQSAEIRAYSTIAEQQLHATEDENEILTELKNNVVADVRERLEVSEITFPSGAATIAIPVGTTELDLWTGAVFFGDGSEDMLSDSLDRLKKDFIRSINLTVSKAYTVEVDGKADHAMAADDTLVEAGISCRTISITVIEVANLKFWGSTNPNATLEGSQSLVVAPADEIQVFTNKVIRDTKAHNSVIADYSRYTMVTFYVANGMNQDVTAQVYGTRSNSVSGAVTIGGSFNVAAADAVAKAISASATGMMPYMFVRLTAGTIPSTGNADAYAICRYTS